MHFKLCKINIHLVNGYLLSSSMGQALFLAFEMIQ